MFVLWALAAMLAIAVGLKMKENVKSKVATEEPGCYANTCRNTAFNHAEKHTIKYALF